jgi:predicted O-methyltransferase YrrM
MDLSRYSFPLLNMLTQYQAPAILMAAHEVGVFLGRATARELAGRLQVPERSLGILLRACVALGLLAQDENGFACGPMAAETLVPGTPGYLGRLVDKEAAFYRAWAGLAACVRADRAALAPIQDRAREEPETTRNFLLALDDIARLYGGEFAALVDLGNARRLLDAGGGVGSYSVALARRRPDLHATILELPEVVPWAREFVAAAGLSDRVAVEPLDLLVDPLPPGYDVVLFSNIFHDHPPAVNQGLLAKAYQALPPGGQVVIYEFLLEPDRVTPAVSATFAVMMLVENQGGNAYTGQEIEGWLAGAGFRNPATTRLPAPSPMGLVVGYR